MTKEVLKKFILPAAIAVAAVAAIIVAVVVSSNKEEVYRLVKVKSFEGAVTVQREGKMDAFEGLQLISEDSVEVGESSLLELLADSDKHIVAEENTAFMLHSTGTETSGNITIDLLYGKSLFTIDNKLNDESTFEVKTPNATMSVRGTSFSTEYDTAERATNVEVFDGVVHVTCDGGELLLEKGDAVTIKVNEDEMEVVEGANLDSNDPNGENDGTEQLFYVGMTYAQEENYAKADAEYQFGLSEYVGETAENAELSNKIIEIVKAHSDEVNKYFEANKGLAAQNKTESEDIAKWFEDTISIGDKYYSVDKVVMDIAVSASSVDREYFTSDTYKVKSNGREMYYCASGVVFEFYGEVMEAPAVTTVPEINTAVTTTPVVTTVVTEASTTESVTTTTAETTVVSETTVTEETEEKKEKIKNNMSKMECYYADGTLDYYYLYDNLEGNRIKSSYYSKDGKLVSYFTFDYNSDGMRTKGSYYENDGRLYSYSLYEYNSDGNLIKHSSYKEDGTSYGYDEYVYDSNGNKITEHSYSSDGTLCYYVECEYDSKGNKITDHGYDSDGSFLNHTKYEYDSDGNEIKSSEYNEDGTLDSYVLKEYNSDGNIIKWSHYKSDGTLTGVTKYTYETE